jgi:type IV pilus assembly protein PilB
VISQRLVRRLCPACKTPRATGPQDAAFLGAQAKVVEVFEPRGCVRCQRTGFLGRIAAFEMFQLDEDVRETVSGGASEKAIARMAKHLTTLQEDAAAKVLADLTTVDEMRRIVVLES